MKTDPARYKPWLSRDVFGFALTSLLSDVSHEMATAVLPAFLFSLGAPAAALGLIEGVADGLSSAAKLWSGWYSDRSGIRKPLATLGYVVTAASQAVFAVAVSWPQVLGGRALGWMGRGARGPVRDAMMADCVPPENYGKAFGFERAMDTAGAVLGPFLAFLFLSRLGYRNLFWLSVIPGALAVLSIASLTRERGAASPDGREYISRMKALPPRYRRFLLAVFVFGLGDFAHTLLILRVTEIFVPRLGAAPAAGIAVLGYALHNVVSALSSYASGHWGDRWRKAPLLAAGYLAAAVTFAGFLFNGGGVRFAIPLFLASGIYLGMEEVLEKAAAAEIIPKDMRALGFGALATANGLGDLISSSAAGWLWTFVSPAAAFGYGCFLSLAGAALMFRFERGLPEAR